MKWRERHLSGLADFRAHSLLPSPGHPECVGARSLGPAPTHDGACGLRRCRLTWRCSSASLTEPLSGSGQPQGKRRPGRPPGLLTGLFLGGTWVAHHPRPEVTTSQTPPPSLAAAHVAAPRGYLTPVQEPWPPGWLFQSMGSLRKCGLSAHPGK